ncbi:hypothetical protein FRZ32_00015 [Sphingosinicella ginsenosidimutans]|uniref:ROK family protein n=1 Tax=Allosphingosinicella ginsenosidimutans TaxID=1176539 RepID=A0A5C6TNA8_9SPHN|nr:hypothetical protein FRZ32_00015 [Sphingosinicella ginsenosidimutans]
MARDEIGPHRRPSAGRGDDRQRRPARRCDGGEAIAIFARILGSFVGDIVLATGTFDGVYLVSPLLGALRPALTDDRFRAAMIGKGRLKKALEPVAVGYAEGRSPRLRGMAAALAARSAASGEPVAPARGLTRAARTVRFPA